MEFAEKLLYAVITAAMPIIVTYICKWLAEKAKEIKLIAKVETFNNTINSIEETIINAVCATSQTYVDSLKADKIFDKEAQLEAFNKTKNAVMSQLTEDAKKILTATYGDVDTYITTMIEAEVKKQK